MGEDLPHLMSPRAGGELSNEDIQDRMNQSGLIIGPGGTEGEDDLLAAALGVPKKRLTGREVFEDSGTLLMQQAEEEKRLVAGPDVDFSRIRGNKGTGNQDVGNDTRPPEPAGVFVAKAVADEEADLANLAELVPGLRSKRSLLSEMDAADGPAEEGSPPPPDESGDDGDEGNAKAPTAPIIKPQDDPGEKQITEDSGHRSGLDGNEAQRWSTQGMPQVSSRLDMGKLSAEHSTPAIRNVDSMQVQDSHDEDVPPTSAVTATLAEEDTRKDTAAKSRSSSSMITRDDLMPPEADDDQNLAGFDADAGDDGDSSGAGGSSANEAFYETKADPSARRHSKPKSDAPEPHSGATDFSHAPSSASLSTATQTQLTHEVRMPMYLPTFKPATGCTNASDFIVRCFVARLRSGITVVKHGRSRWCKSRLRILHVHSDGRSLSWKPAVGEPSSNKRPPKLDLSTCMEVRHAWSPDPLNPMFTGTPILRQKCEAANAHKSFALIFPKRTVDITAVTADQCKVLMEGFSALCFRLQVANLAGRGKKAPTSKDSNTGEDDGTTASVTLTNNSTPMSPNVGPNGGGRRVKRSNHHR